MVDTDVPTGLGHWLIAVAPIVVLLVLLVVRRWTAAQAAPVGLAVGVVAAVAFFGTDMFTLAVAAGKGVWDALFILAVVWPALLLFRVTERAGAQSAIRHGLAEYSTDRMFLVLAFGWVFASFLQGITGFGTPIAVVAPLLVALGVKPLMAVVIPLIGHAWANLFGTLGVAWLGTLQVIDLEDERATALFTAVLLIVPIVASGVTIAWMVGRAGGLRHALPMIAIVAAVYAVGQGAVAMFDPVLAAFIPASVGLLILYPLSHWQRYSEPADGVDLSHVFAEEADSDGDGALGEGSGDDGDESAMGLGAAMLPYVALTAVAVLTLSIPPLRDALEQVEYGPAFPGTVTDHGVEQEETESYSPVTVLTHPGVFLLVGAGVGAIVAWRIRSRTADGATPGEDDDRPSLWVELAEDATPASVAVVGFLALSAVLESSGQVLTLASGVEAVTPGPVYLVLAASIGLLGSFMTTSNTASNVLFAPLQQAVAEAEGLSEAAVIGGQHAGGAIGNSIAPANIALGTGTAGINGQEGQVLRRVLPFALGSTVAVGLLTLALASLF
jgi:lactate permease